jgi:hypothetical protein
MPQPRPPLGQQPLPEVLTFHPEWWTDPLPPWLFTADLDKSVLVQIATVHLEAAASALEGRANAARRTMEILQKVQ